MNIKRIRFGKLVFKQVNLNANKITKTDKEINELFKYDPYRNYAERRRLKHVSNPFEEPISDRKNYELQTKQGVEKSRQYIIMKNFEFLKKLYALEKKYRKLKKDQEDESRRYKLSSKYDKREHRRQLDDDWRKLNKGTQADLPGNVISKLQVSDDAKKRVEISRKLETAHASKSQRVVIASTTHNILDQKEQMQEQTGDIKAVSGQIMQTTSTKQEKTEVEPEVQTAPKEPEAHAHQITQTQTTSEKTVQAKAVESIPQASKDTPKTPTAITKGPISYADIAKQGAEQRLLMQGTVVQAGEKQSEQKNTTASVAKDEESRTQALGEAKTASLDKDVKIGTVGTASHGVSHEGTPSRSRNLEGGTIEGRRIVQRTERRQEGTPSRSRNLEGSTIEGRRVVQRTESRQEGTPSRSRNLEGSTIEGRRVVQRTERRQEGKVRRLERTASFDQGTAQRQHGPPHQQTRAKLTKSVTIDETTLTGRRHISEPVEGHQAQGSTRGTSVNEEEEGWRVVEVRRGGRHIELKPEPKDIQQRRAQLQRTSRTTRHETQEGTSHRVGRSASVDDGALSHRKDLPKHSTRRREIMEGRNITQETTTTVQRGEERQKHRLGRSSTVEGTIHRREEVSQRKHTHTSGTGRREVGQKDSTVTPERRHGEHSRRHDMQSTITTGGEGRTLASTGHMQSMATSATTGSHSRAHGRRHSITIGGTETQIKTRPEAFDTAQKGKGRRSSM